MFKHMYAAMAAMACASVLSVSVFAAESGYLDGLRPAYVPPAPPAPGSVFDQMDLVMVRAAQPAPGSAEAQDAVVDANAYLPKDIIMRFDAAAGVPLKAAERPILLRVLEAARAEGGQAISDYKRIHPRNRPYVGHSDITPCQTGLRDWESYPSGHSSNGMITAMILADVFPDRAQMILARGILYGDRRVVCGVHHPIDVQQGRTVAMSYMNAVRVQPKYQADIACAKHEDAVLRKAEAALPDNCKK